MIDNIILWLRNHKVPVFCTLVIAVIILSLWTGATHLDEFNVVLMIILIAIGLWDIIKSITKKHKEDIEKKSHI